MNAASAVGVSESAANAAALASPYSMLWGSEGFGGVAGCVAVRPSRGVVVKEECASVRVCVHKKGMRELEGEKTIHQAGFLHIYDSGCPPCTQHTMNEEHTHHRCDSCTDRHRGEASKPHCPSQLPILHSTQAVELWGSGALWSEHDCSGR